MADIRPFKGIRYSPTAELDFGNLIAPPYDVLDQEGKDKLLLRSTRNITQIDLPHMPPKVAGPDEAYVNANRQFRAWLSDRILIQDQRPAFYPYVQSYAHAGRAYRRRGFIARVRLQPFGQGDIVPHERTYKGPIEDRLKLMRSTQAQLSPIFGLFSDPRNAVTDHLFDKLGAPDAQGTLDAVHNELWHVDDPAVHAQVTALMKDKPVYIADGHHRYTTALQYQKEATEKNGGPLPEDHPANFCMFVLVAMQDPGLVIQATHRLLGGLRGFDVGAFARAVSEWFTIETTPLGAGDGEAFGQLLEKSPAHTFGLYDAATETFRLLKPKRLDILAQVEPGQSQAWRELDVAILQRYLIEEVLQKQFAGEAEITRGYTPSAQQVPHRVDGNIFQAAILLQPTPLKALEDLGKTGEVMPQKSTYFYPKVATGLVISSLQ